LNVQVIFSWMLPSSIWDEMFNLGKTSFTHVSKSNKLLYLLINIFLNIFSLVAGFFSAHISVLFRIIPSDLNCYILIFLKRKGASSLVITSSCGFSTHYFRSDIVILVIFKFCVWSTRWIRLFIYGMCFTTIFRNRIWY